MLYPLTENLVFRALVLVLLILIPSLLNAQEQETQAVATGMAVGTSVESRNMAIDDALRQAVRQTVGIYISSETLVENMELVTERIYSQTQGYIKNYEILNENHDNEEYRVTVSARVKTVELVDDLGSIGLLISKKQHPRVMVVLDSRQIDVRVQNGSKNIENQIEGHLMQKGFALVDANQVTLKKQMEAAIFENGYSQASKVAKDFGAEVLIAGTVRREFVNTKQVYGMKVPFYSNTIQLKAFETDSARVLYSGYRTRPPTGIDHLGPLEQASSELIEEMIASILEKWRKDVSEGDHYQLKISNTQFKELALLTKELKAIHGLSGVKTRNFQSDIALLEVKYIGPLEELVGKLSQIQSPAFEITGFQANTIDIVINQ